MSDKPEQNNRESTDEIGNPYVGPRPYERRESKLFFGREEEIDILTGLVVAHQSTLFFAQSGAGKSSLLQAGLIPKLTRKKVTGRGDQARLFQLMYVAPILKVGLGIPPSTTGGIRNIYVFSAALSLLPDADPNDLSQLSLSEALSLYLAERAVRLREWQASPTRSGKPRPPLIEPDITLLVFDQFEELFTTYPERWEDREGFFHELDELLQSYPNMHQLLAMREDYIAQLTPYENLLPSELRNRYRMERLKRKGALEAVKKPAALAGKEYADQVAEDLVDNLLQIRKKGSDLQPAPGPNSAQARVRLGEYVEPVHLQIVCRDLWSKLPADQAVIEASHVDELGDVDEALTAFYQSTIERTKSRVDMSERYLREWFDTQLITPSNTRSLVYFDEAKGETAGLQNDAVTTLRDAWIIRADVRGGNVWYELTHDRLVEPILKSNARWFADYNNPVKNAYDAWAASNNNPGKLITGQQLADAEAYAGEFPAEVRGEEQSFLQASRRNQDRLDREEEEKRRRRWYMALAALVVLSLLTVATLFALNSRRRAVENEVAAVEARSTAVQNEAAAVEAKATAVQNEAEAVAARATAQARQLEAARNESLALSTLADQQLTVDPVDGIALGLSALPAQNSPRPYVAQAEAALQRAVRRSLETDFLHASVHVLDAENVALNRSSSQVAIGASDRDDAGQEHYSVKVVDVLPLPSLETHSRPTETLRLKNVLPVSDTVRGVEWSDAGDLLAYTDSDLTVWRDGSEIASLSIENLDTGNAFLCARWRPGSDEIAFCTGCALSLWSPSSTGPTLIEDFSQSSACRRLQEVSWSSDGRDMVVTGRGMEATVGRWDEGDEVEWSTLGVDADSAAFVTSQLGVLHNSSRDIVHLFDVDGATRRITSTLAAASENQQVEEVQVDPEHERLALFVGNGAVDIWDLTDGSTLDDAGSSGTLAGSGDKVVSADWQESGRYIVTANPDGSLTLWDGSEDIYRLYGHGPGPDNRNRPDAHATWLDERRVLSYGEDGTLRAWTTHDASGKPLCRTDSKRQITCVTYSNELAAMAGAEVREEYGGFSHIDADPARGWAFIYSLDTSDSANHLRTDGVLVDLTTMDSLALSDTVTPTLSAWIDAGLLITTIDDQFHIYRPDSGMTHTWPNEHGTVVALEGYRDSRLATVHGDEDRTIIAWQLDAEEGPTVLASIEAPGTEIPTVHWSEDGESLLIVAGRPYEWKLGSDQLNLIQVPSDLGKLDDIALSQDGRLLAVVVGRDICVIDRETGEVFWIREDAHDEDLAAIRWIEAPSWERFGGGTIVDWEDTASDAEARPVLVTVAPDGVSFWDGESGVELISLDLYSEGFAQVDNLITTILENGDVQTFTPDSIGKGFVWRHWATMLSDPQALRDAACNRLTRLPAEEQLAVDALGCSDVELPHFGVRQATLLDLGQ